LFAGLIAVADASDDGITSEELEVFAKFFGKYAFNDKLDLEKVKQTIERRIKEVKAKASQTQCMQIVRDLCVMAQADGRVCGPERVELERIAAGLDISVAFIDQVLEQDKELD